MYQAANCLRSFLVITKQR